MKRIKRDGETFYVTDGCVHLVNANSTRLQLLQVANFAIDKQNNLIKLRASASELVESYLHQTGESIQDHELKDPYNWEDANVYVTYMLNSLIENQNKNRPNNFDSTFSIDKIRISVTRDGDVSYITINAPRQSGKTEFLKDLYQSFSGSSVDYLVWFAPIPFGNQGKQIINPPRASQVIFCDEMLPIAIPNKSIVVHVRTR